MESETTRASASGLTPTTQVSISVDRTDGAASPIEIDPVVQKDIQGLVASARTLPSQARKTLRVRTHRIDLLGRTTPGIQDNGIDVLLDGQNNATTTHSGLNDIAVSGDDTSAVVLDDNAGNTTEPTIVEPDTHADLLASNSANRVSVTAGNDVEVLGESTVDVRSGENTARVLSDPYNDAEPTHAD